MKYRCNVIGQDKTEFIEFVESDSKEHALRTLEKRTGKFKECTIFEEISGEWIRVGKAKPVEDLKDKPKTPRLPSDDFAEWRIRFVDRDPANGHLSRDELEFKYIEHLNSVSPQQAADFLEHKSKTEPRGIGGWLSLFSWGIVLSMLFLPTTAFLWLKQIDQFTVDQKYYINLTVAVHLFLFCFVTYAAWNLFNKWRATPKVMTALLIVIPVVYWMMFGAGFSMPGSAHDTGVALIRAYFRSAIGSTVSAIIWIPYWRKSRRVKNTFTPFRQRQSNK